MAKEKFIDSHLDLAFSPLTVMTDIVVEGNVPDVQTYDRSNGQYSPDYTQTFLVLRPVMEVADPDGIIPGGRVQMVNMHWYVTEEGVETEIQGGTDFQLVSDGRLSVKRNVKANQTLLFRFTGEYLDPRTGEVFRMEDTHAVGCEAESAPVRLLLSHPQLTEWDPTTGDPAKVTIRAALMIGTTEVPAANREFVWEKKDANDTSFQRIYPPTHASYDWMDYDVEIGTDGKSLILDRDLMGYEVEIRCRAKYDPYGNPSSVTLTDSSPSEQARFVRKIPVPTVVAMTPRRFDPSQKTFSPEAVYYIGRRVIADPSKWWRTRWYMSKGVAAGTVSRTLVGEGVKPALSTSQIAHEYGATLQTGVTEIGPKSALIDASGNVITVNGDSPIVATVTD